MPLKKIAKGYKWGNSGKEYTGKNAKEKAIKQGIAIEGTNKFSKIMKKSSKKKKK
jgi:hypothetical protein